MATHMWADGAAAAATGGGVARIRTTKPLLQPDGDSDGRGSGFGVVWYAGTRTAAAQEAIVLKAPFDERGRRAVLHEAAVLLRLNKYDKEDRRRVLRCGGLVQLPAGVWPALWGGDERAHAPPASAAAVAAASFHGALCFAMIHEPFSKTLLDFIRYKHPLGVGAHVTSIFARDLFVAARHLADHRIAHTRIAPANIYVMSKGDRGARAKLANFEAAVALDSLWNAPERGGAGPTDHRPATLPLPIPDQLLALPPPPPPYLRSFDFAVQHGDERVLPGVCVLEGCIAGGVGVGVVPDVAVGHSPAAPALRALAMEPPRAGPGAAVVGAGAATAAAAVAWRPRGTAMAASGGSQGAADAAGGSRDVPEAGGRTPAGDAMEAYIDGFFEEGRGVRGGSGRTTTDADADADVDAAKQTPARRGDAPKRKRDYHADDVRHPERKRRAAAPVRGWAAQRGAWTRRGEDPQHASTTGGSEPPRHPRTGTRAAPNADADIEAVELIRHVLLEGDGGTAAPAPATPPPHDGAAHRHLPHGGAEGAADVGERAPRGTGASPPRGRSDSRVDADASGPRRPPPLSAAGVEGSHAPPAATVGDERGGGGGGAGRADNPAHHGSDAGVALVNTFVAPEQVLGAAGEGLKDVDMWSCGCVIFAMLTGRDLFAAAAAAATTAATPTPDGRSGVPHRGLPAHTLLDRQLLLRACRPRQGQAAPAEVAAGATAHTPLPKALWRLALATPYFREAHNAAGHTRDERRGVGGGGTAAAGGVGAAAPVFVPPQAAAVPAGGGGRDGDRDLRLPSPPACVERLLRGGGFDGRPDVAAGGEVSADAIAVGAARVAAFADLIAQCCAVDPAARAVPTTAFYHPAVYQAGGQRKRSGEAKKKQERKKEGSGGTWTTTG